MAVAPKGVASNLVAVFADMWSDPRRGGAFYAGLTPTLSGIIPYSGTTWATYETLKEHMLRRRGQPPCGELPPMQNAVAGGAAGILGQAVSYPLDVVRRRMQTAVLQPGARAAPTMLAVFADLLRTEGVAGCYKGLSVNFLKAPIAMGLSFSTYSLVKQYMLSRHAAAACPRPERVVPSAAAGGAGEGAGYRAADARRRRRPVAPAAVAITSTGGVPRSQ
jgi:solute carrier family 25 protein 42